MVTLSDRWLLSDVLYSDACRTKKAFQYVKRMLPLFCAVVKLCTTNRLFTYFFCKYVKLGSEKRWVFCLPVGEKSRNSQEISIHVLGLSPVLISTIFKLFCRRYHKIPLSICAYSNTLKVIL